MNDLDKLSNVTVKAPVIIFPGYEELLIQANHIAEKVSSIEVTEDNVKESKKTIANVRKSVKRLDERRIAIKKAILEPYEELNDKVKTIQDVLNKADEQVRSQIREMEEKERDEKEQRLHEQWNKRITAYDNAKIMSFEDWITPKHLNKTYSFGQAEDSMVDFLEKCERDIQVLREMQHSEELVSMYRETLDVSLAISIVNKRYAEMEEIRNSLQTDEEEETREKVAVFKITGEKDIHFVELLLTENKINYKKEYL